MIRISQRPNHEKGFGFSISGGREFGAPFTVEKVVRGVTIMFVDKMIIPLILQDK